MTHKLLIVGGGPAGLSAAINAASEGLDVTVFDRAPALGGQFHESNDIENYPGVPVVTGKALSGAMISQAASFGVEFCCPTNIAKLAIDGQEIVLTSDDYEEHRGDACILALGVQYKRLEATNLARYMGGGVYYGSAPYAIAHPKDAVGIVGGGNSAGQEAVKLAVTGRNVYMFVRSGLDKTMSRYLRDIIATHKNIIVMEGVTVTWVEGKAGHMNEVLLSDQTRVACAYLFIFIGATPHTLWLEDVGIAMDDRKFIEAEYGFKVRPNTTQSAGPGSLNGVFAIGDVRSGSTKRIAAAVGEGSTVMPAVHEYLATLGGK